MVPGGPAVREAVPPNTRQPLPYSPLFMGFLEKSPEEGPKLRRGFDEDRAEWPLAAEILEYKQMSEAVGMAYRLHGYQNAPRVFTAQLEAESQHAYIPDWFIAQIYGYLGDKDRAFIYLERSYKLRDGISSLNEPGWDPVRDDPRFSAMMQKMGLPR